VKVPPVPQPETKQSSRRPAKSWMTSPPVVLAVVGGVGRIRELVGEKPAVPFGQLARLRHRAGGARGGGSQDHPGTIGAHQLAALDREGFGHHRDEAIAARRGHHRQRHAGIAGSGLDDGTPGRKHAALLGIEHDRQGQAILHRTAGIEGLDLGVDRGVRGSDPVEAHDRGAADGVDDGVVQGHGSLLE